MYVSSRILKGNNGNTRIQDRKKVLEHSHAASLHVDSPSRLRQSTSERGEHGERLKCNSPIDCNMEEGAVLSKAEPGNLAASTSEEVSTQVTEITNDEQVHETEPISREKVKIWEATATSQAELPVGLTYVTPQKQKLMEVNDSKDSAGQLQEVRQARKKRIVAQLLAIPLANLPQMALGRIQSAKQVILLRSLIVQGSGQGNGGRC
jgi:hypothetical protein